MANVIYLKDRPPSPRRTAAAKERADGASGQILLFTGVRYERYSPETRPTTSGPKRARKR